MYDIKILQNMTMKRFKFVHAPTKKFTKKIIFINTDKVFVKIRLSRFSKILSK